MKLANILKRKYPMCPHSLSVFCYNPSDKNLANCVSGSLQRALICDYTISLLGIYPKELILRSSKYSQKISYVVLFIIVKAVDRA